MRFPPYLRRLLPALAGGLVGCLHFQPMDRPLGDDISDRAAVLDKLQHGSMSRRAQVVATKVLLATHGEDLTRLKSQIDRGSDGATLHRLIYRDLTDDILREAILAHFHRETRSGEVQASRAPRDRVRVVSDIDDTLIRSLCDERYHKRVIFPGVLEFYRALSIGTRAQDAEAQTPGEVTFLSARPRELVRSSYSSLLNPLMGKNAAIIGSYNLLPSPGAWPGIANVHEVQAFAKFRNFVQLAALFPESDFVFIGDSGQGDMLSGELMLYHQPERLRAVFIHQLVTDGKHGVFCPHPRSANDLDRGVSRVFFFDTYVGAAAQAHDWGMISDDSLFLVAKAAIETLNRQGREIVTEPHRNLVVSQFRRDLRRVQEILSSRSNDADRRTLPDLLFGEAHCGPGVSASKP